MKCPVCGNVNTSMVCPKCGFDSSRDYGKYPTLGPVEPGPSASAKRREWQEFQQAWQNWQEQQKTVESIPVEPEPQPAVETAKPVPPSTEPVKPARRFPIWLAAAVCTVVVALAIGIGAGLGGRKPNTTEPGGAVQMQEPVETTTVPPETTQQTTPPATVADPAPWRNNILRSDELVDTNGDSYTDETPVFGSDYRREQICSVTFLDTLTEQPDDAWDVSEAGDGSVMAWVKPNGDLYDLYIGAEGGVSAGESCKDLFWGYENAASIRFGDAFHTENVQDMCFMFCFCSSLTELTLGDGFDTSNVQDMCSMFLACSSLTELTLGDRFDTSNVQNMSGMFNNCSSLTELTLGDGFVTTNADTTFMFYNCPAGDEWGHLVN